VRNKFIFALLMVSILLTFPATGQLLYGKDDSQVIIDKGANWKYTFTPANNFPDLDIDTSAWNLGQAPFSDAGICPSITTEFTRFPLYETLYARQEFELDRLPVSSKLYLAYDNDIVIYLNNKRIFSKEKEGCGAYWDDKIDLSALKLGKNVLMCVVKDRGGSAFFDAKLTVNFQPPTRTETPNPQAITTIFSGDVTISDLDTTSEGIKYKVHATRNGRTFSNARVYIDNEFVGRTDSEGFYVSYIPLPTGSHTITVVYNPLPLTGGGDADISTPVGLSQATYDQLEVGDIGMGSLVPMEDRFFGGAGRVEVADKLQELAVNLRIIIQAKQINTENVVAGIFDVVSNFLPGSAFNPFNLPTSAGQSTDSTHYA